VAILKGKVFSFFETNYLQKLPKETKIKYLEEEEKASKSKYSVEMKGKQLN
jgi:hypothetical protein